MPRRVFILGAGASHSYSLSPTGLRPPLARSIISAYASLPISEDQHVRVGHVVNYIRDNRGISPADFYLWSEDIESFMTEIDDRIRQLRSVLGDKMSVEQRLQWTGLTGAYYQVIFLLECVMNEIQNGPVSPEYRRMVDQLTDDDTVVTFNWDTLLDRALWESGRWSPDTGYGVPAGAVFRDEWVRPKEPVPGAPKLVKLHGSVNWLMPYTTYNWQTGEMYTLYDDPEHLVYVFERAISKYDTFQDRSRTGYEPFSYFYYPPDLPLERNNVPDGYRVIGFNASYDLGDIGEPTRGVNVVHSMPLIIPPTLYKRYDIYGKVFDALWAEAEDAISRCDELHIVGYSFPRTDVLSRQMIKSALTRRQHLVDKVVLVDPYPREIEHVLRQEFGLVEAIVKDLAFDGEII